MSATPIAGRDLSSGLSATMQSARNAATAFEGGVPVHVIDSRSITAGRLAGFGAAEFQYMLARRLVTKIMIEGEDAVHLGA